MIAQLCEKIHLPEEETALALDTLRQHGVLCEKLAHRAFQTGKVGALKKMTALNKARGGAVSLAVTLRAAELTKLQYQKKGIPMDIFYATMSDIPIWCENFKKEYHVPGLDETNWLIQHLRLKLFRLGRLQFMPSRVQFEGPVSRLQMKSLPLKSKDVCVDVHIPQGESLPRDECLSSFRQADSFFRTFEPELSYSYYTCSSWLLSPYNREMLPPESNIVQFMDLWEIPFGWPKPEQAIERIFGASQPRPELYPGDTSLQRSARKRLIEGKPLGTGFGYREAGGAAQCGSPAGVAKQA